MTKPKNITPTESICPIYLETPDPQEIAQEKIRIEAEKTEQAAKAAAREAILNKLGLTADEAAALFG